MLIDRINGIMQDEYNYNHYSINNVGTKPIKSINKTNTYNMGTTDSDKSTLDRATEVMTLEEHFGYLNQNTDKIKIKVLKKF